MQTVAIIAGAWTAISVPVGIGIGRLLRRSTALDDLNEILREQGEPETSTEELIGLLDAEGWRR